jgi:hypothetical protein|nr:MAG TPA: hypothetical protein [Caudoviricetes sp.]
MFHVKHNKRDGIKFRLFNISITLILNAWVGIHPTTKVCLIFQRAFHTNVTKITNADTINNTLEL